MLLTWPLIFLPRGMTSPFGATRSSASFILNFLPWLTFLVSNLSSRTAMNRVPSGMALGAP